MKINRPIALALALVATTYGAGCRGSSPIAPTGEKSSSAPIEATPPSTPTGNRPSPGETFQVAGIVTDDHGAPVAAVAVIMRYWLDGRIHAPAAVTDASGRYSIEFTSNPWPSNYGRGAARAEIMVDGYDWYWRDVIATGPQLVENFRLHPTIRVVAGNSAEVPVTRDNGSCLGWLYNPCGRFRVTSPVTGKVTLAAEPTEESAARPQLEVCCVDGNEQYGNPITVPIDTATELWVEVGQTGAAVTASQLVVVNTSFQPNH